MKKVILKFLVLTLVSKSYALNVQAQTKKITTVNQVKMKSDVQLESELDAFNNQTTIMEENLTEQQISEQESATNYEGYQYLDQETPSPLMYPENIDNEAPLLNGTIKKVDNIQSKLQLDFKFTSQLQNSGKWAVRIVYLPNSGDPVVMTSYRSNQLIKPASTLKIFTGYLAFINKSYPLKDISYMLHKSDNYMANKALESVGAKYGFKEIPNNGVSELMNGGISVLRKTFDGLLDLDKLKMINGSGLNETGVDPEERLNKVTAQLETSLLAKIYRSSDYNLYKKLLAQPGQFGTLSGRLQATNSDAKIYAKTGTLDQTIALAGYAETKNGVMIYSIIGDELKLKIPAKGRNAYRSAVLSAQNKAKELIDDLVYLHVQALLKDDK